MGKYQNILNEELLALDEIRIELTDGLYPRIPSIPHNKKAPITRYDNLHYPLGTTYLTYGFRGVARLVG